MKVSKTKVPFMTKIFITFIREMNKTNKEVSNKFKWLTEVKEVDFSTPIKFKL